MNKRLLAYPVVAAVALAAVATASAEERRCRGPLGAITVNDLRVPRGATCTLNGTKVNGSIKVERNATLTASQIEVIGNVQADKAALVVLDSNSSVGGHIQIVQGGEARILMTFVKGNIHFDENEGGLVARDNVVGGNVQADENTGGLEIAGNRIDGNLQCKENDPAPTGGGNVVLGNKQGQCRRL